MPSNTLPPPFPEPTTEDSEPAGEPPAPKPNGPTTGDPLLGGEFDPNGEGPVLKLNRADLVRRAIRPRLVHGRHGMGYLPDVADQRDHGFHLLAKDLHAQSRLKEIDTRGLSSVVAPGTSATTSRGKPSRKDEDFHGCKLQLLSPIETQGHLNSCTAHAVIGLVEYLYQAGTGERLDLSRMFLYKATRNLMGLHGDTGAYLRATIKALAAFGTPPEENWPYDPLLLDEEPLAFQYAYAANYKALTYARIDEYNLSGDGVVHNLKAALAAGFPVALGFPVHASIRQVTRAYPLIPLPQGKHDLLLGGHAVLAVGYRTNMPIRGGEKIDVLIIRNSWSNSWGCGGYAYLPMDYVRLGYATDLWTIYASTWLKDQNPPQTISPEREN